MTVGRLEPHRPVDQQTVGCGRCLGPALRTDRGPDRAAQWVGDTTDVDAGSAVQQYPSRGEDGDDVAGRLHIDELGRAAVQPLENLGVGPVDHVGVWPERPTEGRDDLGVPASWCSSPVHLHDRAPLLRNGIGEKAEPHVRDVDFPRELHRGMSWFSCRGHDRLLG